MSRKIEIIGEDVIITENDTIEAIKIDEASPRYQELKAETNNFTENMYRKDKFEEVEATQSDLIYMLMMNGVI